MGSSEWTALKQQNFEAIVAMHLNITKADLIKNEYYNRSYHFIDATAGSGWYRVGETDLDGSPLVFLRNAE